MPFERYTRLPKRQQRLVSVLLGGFAVLVVNSALLWVFEESTAVAYVAMVALHVGLGTLFVAPALGFVALHVRKMPLRLNRAATAAGLCTAVSLGVLLATGFALVAWGGAAFGGALLAVHVGSAGAVALSFAGHVSLKRGAKYHFLEWTGRWKTSLRRALAHPFSVVLLAGLGVTGAFLASTWWEDGRPVFLRHETETAMQEAMAPAEARLAHEGFLDPEDLTGSESCGQAGCHPAVYDQWQQSAHRFSSFNNPYYRRTTEQLAEEKGVAATRWCASCHDPALLLTGQLQQADSLPTRHPTARAGVTCLTCHATEGLRDRRGNGRYVIDAPQRYPFAEAGAGPGEWMHDRLIKAKPEPHANAMLGAVQNTAAFCGSCHKVGVPEAVNDYRWMRGQNQYDSWQASGVSGSTVRSFYVPSEPQTCTSCHMPEVPASKASASAGREGTVRSHRFAAANASVPALKGHGDQVEAVREVLADSAVVLGVARVTVNGRAYGPGEAMPVLRPGDRVELAVAIRNRGVGHRFPAGTNDSNELWLTVTARTASGQPVLASGRLDSAGVDSAGGGGARVDTAAHPLGSTLVDRQGRLVGKRDIQHWRATVFSNTVDPGTARLAHYRFEVPEGAPPITALRARLRYRKFQLAYHRWVFRGSLEGNGSLPEQPIVTVARTTRRAGPPPPAAAGRPLWMRWNDYGIGLLLEGDAQGALDAFARVSDVAPERAAGPINRARVFLREGQLAAAEEALAEADVRQPGSLKSTYFRGLLYKKKGRYERALSAWKRVAETYPRDRVVLLGIARLHHQQSRHERALDWTDRVLDIDPESVPALYNRMLALGALGRTEAMKKARRRYRKRKENESAPAWASKYKADHPAANREAQSIHYHRLRPIASQASVASSPSRESAR